MQLKTNLRNLCDSNLESEQGTKMLWSAFGLISNAAHFKRWQGQRQLSCSPNQFGTTF